MGSATQICALWGNGQYWDALKESWNLIDPAIKFNQFHSREAGRGLRSLVFNACSSAVANVVGNYRERGKIESQIDNMLSRPIPSFLLNHDGVELNEQWCKDHRKRMILAHLLCTRAAIGPDMCSSGLRPAALENINNEMHVRGVQPLSIDFLNELSIRLSFGPSPTRGKAEVWFPLVTNNGNEPRAFLAKFVLVPLKGTGEVFIAVEQAFLPLADDFAQIFHYVPKLLRQRGLCQPPSSISVRVEFTDRVALVQTPLIGGSGGGALALGLWSVWAKQSLKDSLVASFSLASLGASEPDGQCHPICFETVKLNAVADAARISNSERELTFLVADGQQLEFPKVYGVDIKACANVEVAIKCAMTETPPETIPHHGRVDATASLAETEGAYEAEAYVARADEDIATALKLADLLRAHGVDAWDRSKADRGTDMKQAIKNKIRLCDHLLVVLSKAATSSQQLACEIGFALQLHGERKRPRPLIVPVIADDFQHCAIIQPLDFDTKKPVGQELSFAGLSAIDLRSNNLHEEVNELAKQLKPEITFITHVDGDEGRLFWNSAEVYEQLFPVEERDSPENIEQWIREGRFAELNTLPYREVYSVVHKGKTVMGMAYLTSYLDRHWTFGNYLGVLPCYRPDHMTETFLSGITKHLQELDHDMKGIVFEVEPVNWDCLVQATDCGKIRGLSNEEEIKDSLRRLRRLNLYQASGCVALLGSNERPLLLKTPALDGSKDRNLEGEFIVMLHLLGTPEVQLGELLDFLYGGLYGDAFCRGSVKYVGYERYLQDLRKKVEASARSGWKLGEITFDQLALGKTKRRSGTIGMLVNKLKSIARKEGLLDEIAL